jgi:hypothetical protein
LKPRASIDVSQTLLIRTPDTTLATDSQAWPDSALQSANIGKPVAGASLALNLYNPKGDTDCITALSNSRDGIQFQSQPNQLDPLGLQVVSMPDTTPDVDIILIHGIGGSSWKTWSKMVILSSFGLSGRVYNLA